MTTYGMVIDVSRCTGCYNCFLACRDEHVGNDYPPLTAAQPPSGHKWMDVQEYERGKFPRVRVDYLPLPCQQCKEATCISKTPGGSVYRRADGIVVIDPAKAAGQREIVSSCPHRVIYWNEAKNIPQKCTFCAHLLDQGWKQPRCVEACPTQALVFGDLDDPNSEVSKLCKKAPVEDLHPEYGLKPSVRYIALPKRFLAGEVVYANKTETTAKGVQLSLRGGKQIINATTDNYGDFSIEALEPGVDYVLQITAPGYKSREVRVGTRNDTDLGIILLDPA